jgi:tetratricopeptide (TPR) repeat protein
VRGRAWDAIIREDLDRLTVPEFLARHLPTLVTVAQAIAFAHSRGVVHRDLKPSQVMIGDFGETYLMDWGLSLVYDEAAFRQHVPGAPALAAPTRASATAPAGTGVFMAPEQTESTAERIGPWTDLYQLGGCLYYLLTGRFPHPGADMAEAMAHAAFGDVAPPEEANPGRDIPPFLSALAMRALAREPAARVPSARTFQAELADWLSGGAARREATILVAEARERAVTGIRGYEAHQQVLQRLAEARSKWPDQPDLRSARQLVLASFVREALAQGDLILARAQAERMDDTPGRARLLAAIAEREAERQRAAAEREEMLRRLRLEHQRAQELIGFLLGDLQAKLQPIGRLDILDAVVARTLDYIRAEGASDPSPHLRLQRVRATRAAGEVCRSRGDYDAAHAAFEEALREAAGLVAAHPQDLTAARELAAVRHSLGMLLRTIGQLADAESQFGQQRTLLERLAAEHPEDGELRHDLGLAHYGLADLCACRGDLEAALVHNTRQQELFGGLAHEAPENTLWRRRAAGAVADHGWILKAMGDLDGALDRYRTATAELERLVAAEPSNSTLRCDLAFFLNKLGWVHEARGEYHIATRATHRACEIMADLVQEDPANAKWRRLRAVTNARLGLILEAVEDYDWARENFDIACRTLRELLRIAPSDIWVLSWLARASLGLAREAGARGARTELRRHAEEALGLARQIMARGEDVELKVHASHAMALLLLGRADEARAPMEILAHKGYAERDYARTVELAAAPR